MIKDIELEESLLRKYGKALKSLREGGYIVNLSILSRGEKISLEKRIISRERYWFIEESEILENKTLGDIIIKYPIYSKRP